MDKECNYCSIVKKIEEFPPTGRMCRVCKSEYDKERYREKKDEIDTRMRAYGQTDKGREVNRKASVKYGANGKRAEISRRHIERVKADPEKYEEHRRRKKAHRSANYALQKGILTKGRCLICHTTKNVEMHHEDYDKPLEVTWLCKSCHGFIRRVRSKQQG